jgi:hypothetical protein
MLRNGDHDHARASLHRALEVVQQYTHICSLSGDPPEACSYSPAPPLCVVQQENEDENARETNSIIVSVALCDYELAKSQTTTPETNFSFFNHAFLFRFRPHMAMGTSSHQESYSQTLTTVLVFNLAITQHRKGLFEEQNSSQNLRKAIRLYRLATTTSLLTDQGEIQLASWNNVGHIYSHFSEHEKAMKCRTHLFKALFVDPDISLRLTYSYSYSLFYLFVVSSEVRRWERSLSLPSTSSGMTTNKMPC